MGAVTSPTAHDRYLEFRSLHHAQAPLLLPNAWDFASAAALAAAGHRAIGTTSLGVAAAAGKTDAAGTAREETLALARTLAPSLGQVPCLLTVDIEAGFSDDPQEVAALVEELHAHGVVGVNVEDGRADGTLDDVARHQQKVAAIKERVPDVFVNARTDSYWLDGGGSSSALDDTVRRGRAYVEAGADGVFVPGAADDAVLKTLVAELGAPLNVLFAPGRHALPALAELGVARVSTGSLLFRAALRTAVRVADAIRRGEPAVSPDAFAYADVQALTAR